jgi:hypothetical protein
VRYLASDGCKVCDLSGSWSALGTLNSKTARILVATKHSGPWHHVVWQPDTEENRQWLADTTERMKKTNGEVQQRLKQPPKS